MKPIRILVIDNNLQFHEMVKAYFLNYHDRFVLVGLAQTGHEGLRLVRQLQPDVILLDVRMDDINGISLIPYVFKILPSAIIIMLTIYDLDAYRQAADAAGAKGYVLKRNLYATLIPVIEQVLRDASERKKTANDTGTTMS